MNTKVGMERPNHKLTDQDVRDIRTGYALGGVTHRELAAMYGTSQFAIWRVLSGGGWSHIK